MNEIFLYDRKPFNRNGLNLWIAYPGIYNFGMSALGFLTVFEIFDRDENINAERIFSDTKTTITDIRNLDVLLFSFSFELDFLMIFKILEKYKIPFYAKDRDEKYPIIGGGGPVLTANPEPYAKMFDYIDLGDAENKTNKITDTIRKNKGKTKKDILIELSKLEGVYIPGHSYFDKAKGMTDINGNVYTVKKSTDKLKEICVTTPILTENSYFSNTYIIEIARGCPQRCAFCNTSHINTPYRICNTEIIKQRINTGLKYTNKIAFLGAAICSHPDIENLCEYIALKVNTNNNIKLSISSLRADGISEKMAKALVKCGQRHATVALEAGSERLRKVINKNLTKEKFKQNIKILRESGFKGVKIYAMIGLPTETQEDIEEFIKFTKEIKNENKGFDISVSFSSFVPKAHTPFQFVEKENTKSLEKKYEFLQKEMHKIGIKINTSSAKWDYIQALFSRGGRELFDFAVDVYKAGGNITAFKSVMKEYEKTRKIKSFDDIALNSIPYDNINPWDFIQMPLSKEDLIKKCKSLLS